MQFLKQNTLFFIVLLFFATQISAKNSYQYPPLLQKARNVMYQNPAKALRYADSAYMEACALNDTTYLFESTKNWASIYTINGNYDLALEYYLNAEEYLNKNDSLQKADYALNLASIYYHLEDIQNAHRLNDYAYTVYEYLNDSSGMSWSQNLKGLIYMLNDESDLARIAMEASLKLNLERKSIKSVFINYNNLAMIPGNAKKNLQNLQLAIDYNLKNDQHWSLAENYNNMALLYLSEKQYPQAREFNQKASYIADTLSNNLLICNNYKTSVMIAQAEGNYKQAFEFLQKENEINKKLVSLDKIRKIESDAVERREMINRIASEKKNNELLKSEQKKRLILVTLIFVLIIFMLTILYFYLLKVKNLITHAEKEKQSKIEISKRLEAKESQLTQETEQLNMSKAELTNLVFFVKSKDKLLENILSLLQEAQKKSETDPKIKIKSIIALIKGFKDKEIKTNIFSTEIHKAEEQFIERLKERHPGLSKNEVILSSLLRINLSSKEIALLLDSNPKTVNMARYRLRRKLDLETDDNLVAYFEQL